MLKGLLFLLLCCTAVRSVPHGKRRYDLELADQYFEEFVKLHQKQYENEQERQMRFDIFKDNLKRINEQNMESTTAVFGINKFADSTLEELQQTYTGFKHRPMSLRCPYMDIYVNFVDKTFDWRDFNAVSRVKDQGKCGSCWAFSAIGTIEGQYAINYNEMKEFSEQQLIDCDKFDDGCNGGAMDNAFLWIQAQGGIEYEDDYTYTGKQGECKFNETKAINTVAFCNVPDIQGNEMTLQKFLEFIGPISIGVDSTAFFNYEGGILDKCDGRNIDHAVLLVGYGEENGTQYWTIKNSWGENWGEKGYIRVQMHKNCCSMTEFLVSAVLR